MSTVDSTAEVTPAQAMQWRLRLQHLIQPARDLVATSSRLCGVHAQVASGSALIVGVRTAPFAGRDLDDALRGERTLVKACGMRGTLHLFPAAEPPLRVGAFKQRQWPAVHARVGKVPRRPAGRPAPDHRGRRRGAARPGAHSRRARYRDRSCPAQAGAGRSTQPPHRIEWDDVDPDPALREIVTRFLDTYGPRPTKTSDDGGVLTPPPRGASSPLTPMRWSRSRWWARRPG
jgi:DNA glycosylase AlkZ-like